MPRTFDTCKIALTAALAGGIVLLLGIAVVRSEGEATALAFKSAVRERAETVAMRLGSELDALNDRLHRAAQDVSAGAAPAEAARALSSDDHVAWWVDTGVLGFAQPAAVDIDTRQVLDRIADGDAEIVGPLPTAQGRNVILLRAAVSDERQIGLVIALDDLWYSSGVIELVQSGLAVGIESADNRPIYRSSLLPLVDGTYVDLALPGQLWRMTLAPASGWSGAPSVPSVVVVVCLSLLYAFWYRWLALRPQQAQAELATLAERLHAKDGELSSLLHSRSRLEDQLMTSLTVDVATGLPNRASFVEELQSRLSGCRVAASGLLVAVIEFTKLDGLGHVLGSAAAQEVVIVAAEQLQRKFDSSIYLARVAEKELAVCTMKRPQVDPSAFAADLAAALDERVVVGRHAVYSPAAIGIAASHDGYAHGPELLGHAALAAATAAEDGRRWALFRPEARDERISLVQLESDLHAAIDRGELRVHFQPIVGIAKGNVVGFETLLRWRHPTESWIGPDRFIPLAESMGQMGRISEWVLRQAVAYARQWLRLRDAPIYVTVNLTPRDLNRELCDLLFRLLDEADLPPSCLRVEVTETAVVRDFRVAARLIGELDRRGVHVLLDDFGTGYSSLSYLRDLPFHAVKIDRSFVQKMTTDARDFGLVRSIVGLVHYLGMECVAEGIETQEQLDLIGMVDCDYGQGFYFSKPVPAAEAEELIADGQASEAVEAS